MYLIVDVHFCDHTRHSPPRGMLCLLWRPTPSRRPRYTGTRDCTTTGSSPTLADKALGLNELHSENGLTCRRKHIPLQVTRGWYPAASTEMWYLNTERERSHAPLTRCAPREAVLGVLLLTMEKVTRSPFARAHGVELRREITREKQCSLYATSARAGMDSTMARRARRAPE